MHSNFQRRHRRSAVMQRIAGLERALERAQHLLHQDDLTPLLNRRGFRRACDRWAGNGPMAMSACCAMIDLDGFKAINDRHGHPVGDDACLLLERLQQALAGSPLSVPGGAVPLRFSAGVAELHPAESLEQVLERADTALLEAKRRGKAMVRLSGPPARSAQAATANTCDRQPASASLPIAIDQRERDG